MKKLAWRVPISTQHPSIKWVSHLMPRTTDTSALFTTPCGLEINPGFAVAPRPGSTQCKKCARLGGND